jgi:circadian clock protein KaiC
VIDRLPSGAPGLDEVLAGGLPANATNLILGLPGSGKTLLAQQFVFANATPERPAVYLSTVSEPFEKIIRYGQGLSFFDATAVGERVFYEDLGNTLLGGGLDAVLEQVKTLLDSHEPGLLVIDSFKPFAAFAASDKDHRRFLHELGAQLSVRPVANIWVGEYSANELPNAPEFAVADAVLWLTSARRDEREFRLLQVLKLRGSGFLSGKHAYRLSADGVQVFPRLADAGESGPYRMNERRVSSGVETLDPMLGEGYRAGSSTLVAGPVGAGKTILGLHFVFDGIARGEPAVIATFEENPSQLARVAAGFGWSLEKRDLHLMYRSAVDLYLDEWVYELLAVIDETEAARVFIDGMGHLMSAAAETVRFREYMYSLVQRCSRQAVNLMMSLESPELFGATRLSDLGLSQVADNVLLLHFLSRDSRYRRALTVLKSRASPTEPRPHAYTITGRGITLEPDRSRVG